MPMLAPLAPVYFIQPKVEPASTDTLATPGVSTESLRGREVCMSV